MKNRGVVMDNSKIKKIVSKLKENEYYTFIADKDTIIQILNEYNGSEVKLPYNFRITEQKIWMVINLDGDLLVQKPLEKWDLQIIRKLDKQDFTMKSLLNFKG